MFFFIYYSCVIIKCVGLLSFKGDAVIGCCTNSVPSDGVLIVYTMCGVVWPIVDNVDCWCIWSCSLDSTLFKIVVLSLFLCILRWLANVSDRRKYFLQMVQMYGRSPVWERMCLVKWASWIKALLHNVHRCGLSPVWIFLCFENVEELVNDFWQTSHLYDFSPVCIFVCSLRLAVLAKVFWQTSHMYGRSPVCERICTFRLPKNENAWPQIEHWKGRKPLCTAWWFRRLVGWPNCLWHVLHE